LQPIAAIEGATVIELSSDDIWLLKELAAAGANGRSIGTQISGSLIRLAKAGYVTIRASNAKSTLFAISPRGSQALARAPTDDL
jgi:hypothetical protein